MKRAGVVLGIGLSAMSVGAAAGAESQAGSTCRVPRLTHLVVSVARERAARAGCRLHLVGAMIERPTIQTVQRQSPAAGEHGPSVTLWINPLCRGSAAQGPQGAEPRITPGPTELISGFYLNGGPLRRFSTSGCRRAAVPPGGGTVQVFNPLTGAIVATRSSTDGHFTRILLPAGSYTIVGTFAGAIVNDHHAKIPISVQIPPGRSVRQDFTLQIP